MENKKDTFYLSMAAPIKVIKYNVIVTCFRTLFKTINLSDKGDFLPNLYKNHHDVRTKCVSKFSCKMF